MLCKRVVKQDAVSVGTPARHSYVIFPSLNILSKFGVYASSKNAPAEVTPIISTCLYGVSSLVGSRFISVFWVVSGVLFGGVSDAQAEKRIDISKIKGIKKRVAFFILISIPPLYGGTKNQIKSK